MQCVLFLCLFVRVRDVSLFTGTKTHRSGTGGRASGAGTYYQFVLGNEFGELSAENGGRTAAANSTPMLQATSQPLSTMLGSFVHYVRMAHDSLTAKRLPCRIACVLPHQNTHFARPQASPSTIYPSITCVQTYPVKSDNHSISQSSVCAGAYWTQRRRYRYFHRCGLASHQQSVSICATTPTSSQSTRD